MIALIRYQLAVLLRSHRWLAPVLGYLVLVVSVGAADAGEQTLRAGLVWSAAMLVPVVAWLTRAALTAEPASARACAAAAAGRARSRRSWWCCRGLCRPCWPRGGGSQLLTAAVDAAGRRSCRAPGRIVKHA